VSGLRIDPTPRVGLMLGRAVGLATCGAAACAASYCQGDALIIIE
jgi:hypothetical protein